MKIFHYLIFILLLSTVLISDSSAQEIKTYFNVEAVDDKNNIIEGPLIIFVNITYLEQDFDNVQYITLETLGNDVMSRWNVDFYPSGTKIELIAIKDGYYNSQPFIFFITENTPLDGLLFEHTFVLFPLPVEELPTFSEIFEFIDNQTFEITLSTTSNYSPNSIILNEKFKSLFIEVTETNNEGRLIISLEKSFLSGPFRVLIDNVLSSFTIDEDSNYVTLTIEYPEGKHSIEITATDIYELELSSPILSISELDSEVPVDELISISGSLYPIESVVSINLVLQSPSNEEIFRTIQIFADGSFEYAFQPDQLGEWFISGNFNFDNKIIESANTISFTAVDVVKESEIPSDEPLIPSESPDPESPESEPEPSSNVITSDDETPWLYYIAISLVSTIVAALAVFVLYVKLILPKKSDSGKSELKLSDILSRILPKKTETTIDDPIAEDPSKSSKEEELRRKEEELKRKEEELLRKEQELEENKEANDSETNNDSQNN